MAYNIVRGYTQRIDPPQNQARLFAAGSSQYMESSTAPVLDQPFTWSVWFRRANLATDGLMSMASSTFNHKLNLLTIFDGTIDFVIRAGAAPTEGVATTTTTYSVNTWHHVAVVARAANDRSILLDVGGEGTDVTNVNPNDMEIVGIAEQLASTTTRAQFFSGDIFMPAIWSAALTQSEIYDVYRGKLPLLVRPQSIKGCWDASGNNLVSNLHRLVATNAPAWSTNVPRVRNVQMQPYGFVAAAAGIVPLIQHHRQQQGVI